MNRDNSTFLLHIILSLLGIVALCIYISQNFGA